MKNAHLLAVALAALPLAVSAQNGTYGPTAGAREFTLAGSGTNDKDFDHGSWGLSASYGQYMTENLQWVLRQSVNYADTADHDDWVLATRAGLDYHFDLGNWRPFIGANIGYIYGDGVDNTGIAGPELGVKYYVKPETFLYLQTEYQFFFESADDINDNFDDGAFAHTVGVGLNF
ncbi:MAG: hypothetical protein WCZ87_01620 [Thiohalobacteraceae bacterium]